jgi:hypothetical protein
MNWQEENKLQTLQVPEAIRKAHDHSSNHRREIEGRDICGCFHCCSTFLHCKIKDWIDENSEGIGQCAHRPRCGIDSVIGSLSGFPIKEDFWEEMKRYWFSSHET